MVREAASLRASFGERIITGFLRVFVWLTNFSCPTFGPPIDTIHTSMNVRKWEVVPEVELARLPNPGSWMTTNGV